MFNQEQLSKMSDERLTQLKDPYNSDPQIVALAKDEINRRKTLEQQNFDQKLAAEQNKTVRSAAQLTGRYAIIAAVLGALILCLLTYIANYRSCSRSYSPLKPVEKSNTSEKTNALVKTNSISLFNPPK